MQLKNLYTETTKITTITQFQKILETCHRQKFLEKYWQDIFNYGEVVLNDGTKSSIPRYYENGFLKTNRNGGSVTLHNLKHPASKKRNKKQSLKNRQQTLLMTTDHMEKDMKYLAQNNAR